MEDLEAAGRETGVPAAIAKTVRESLYLAKTQAKDGVVVVSGSVYLVGEVRSILLSGGIE
jgi:folylpolyglutamate synthase/dihydropteroate synthase